MTRRRSDHAIDPAVLDRWSPRAFADERITTAELETILEAARWAPSAYNLQPWRFIHAKRGTPAFASLLDLLMPFNRTWAQHAAALVFLASDGWVRQAGQEPKPSPSHSFDAGAAWALLALQARRMGWHSHAMGGIENERARVELGLPEGFRMEVAIAIGRLGDAAALDEKQRAREMPSDRQPLETIAYEGRYRG